MDIIFKGQHNTEEAAESLLTVLRLFKERYSIGQFREMHLQVTLLDDEGEEVELVDNETSQVFRMLEVYKKANEIKERRKNPVVHLVVDNTH